MSTTNRKKFETENVAVQGLIGNFHQQISQLVVDLQPTSLLEVGCGEGFFMEAIHHRLPELPMLGLDNNAEALADGRQIFPDFRFESGDIYQLNQRDASWDVVVASEVLEHLDRPLEALRELRRVAQRYVLLSVPWEPWFRLGSLGRGKHLRRWGNHPEHINHWSPASFRTFVEAVLPVERMITFGSFPWLIALAKV